MFSFCVLLLVSYLKGLSEQAKFIGSISTMETVPYVGDWFAYVAFLEVFNLEVTHLIRCDQQSFEDMSILILGLPCLHVHNCLVHSLGVLVLDCRVVVERISETSLNRNYWTLLDLLYQCNRVRVNQGVTRSREVGDWFKTCVCHFVLII
jgi:hypothetical protein